MRLIVTGGGTGGHVYPALEIARYAATQGAEVLYLGSLRGQEGAACAARGVEFQGFASQPVYSVRTLRGLKSLAANFRCVAQAKQAMCAWKPDRVFSTGGYSSAPVVAAARALGIPYVLFEANSVPGRSIRYFAKDAKVLTYVFKITGEKDYGCPMVRTGMPLRPELREAASRLGVKKRQVLIVGGSQGSAFLNEHIPLAASLLRGSDLEWLHVTGRANFDAMQARRSSMQLPDTYRLEPYLESEAMARAYAESSLVIARSGGTLADFALFGLPSVLVPLATSADSHQLRNAQEFAALGAATVLEEANFDTHQLAEAVRDWFDQPERREAAQAALASWNCPNATEAIWRCFAE